MANAYLGIVDETKSKTFQDNFNKLNVATIPLTPEDNSKIVYLIIGGKEFDRSYEDEIKEKESALIFNLGDKSARKELQKEIKEYTLIPDLVNNYNSFVEKLSNKRKIKKRVRDLQEIVQEKAKKLNF